MVLEDSTKIDSIDVVTIDAFEFILSKLQVKLSASRAAQYWL